MGGDLAPWVAKRGHAIGKKDTTGLEPIHDYLAQEKLMSFADEVEARPVIIPGAILD